MYVTKNRHECQNNNNNNNNKTDIYIQPLTGKPEQEWSTN